MENGFTIFKNKTVTVIFCPDKKCMDPALKLGYDPIQFAERKRHSLVLLGCKIKFWTSS